MMTERAQRLAREAGKKEPKAYTNGPRDFERLCAEEDLDLVYTATPWEWHVPVMLAAMKHGKHVATEVPAAQTVEEERLVDHHAEEREGDHRRPQSLSAHRRI